jgi:hypothetical protein
MLTWNHHRIAIMTAALSLCLCLGPSAAVALSVGSGGFDQTRACSTTNCAAGTQTFTLDGGVAPVTGTIVLDTAGLELDFSITVNVLSMIHTGGGEDNGVARVEFTSTTYVGTAVPLMGPFPSPGGNLYLIGPFAQADIDGTLVQLDDTETPVSTPDDFMRTATLTGSCGVPDLGDAITCGFQFGLSDFAFDIGDPGDGFDPQQRSFQHTLNVTTLPEPGVAVMVGLGMMMLGLRGRPRSQRG